MWQPIKQSVQVEKYGDILGGKTEIVVINKTDALIPEIGGNGSRIKAITDAPILTMSGVTGENIEKCCGYYKCGKSNRKQIETEEIEQSGEAKKWQP